MTADVRGRLQEGLAGRYQLERELGRGGMATVYLAQDVKHDRKVALKVLQPELALSLGPERFQREIKLAARLQHPHILTVHDSGEAAGQLWFTMPFVEGESLRDRLRRERQLPVEDALRVATEAARALDYAHQHGVVHRDIKPENILLTRDGSTMVADFGIARALSDDDGLTQTGLAIGTPAYMSPEQAAGDAALDARTDLYSLAAVLYEMLAGEAPWTGPTAQAIAAKRLSQPPPSVGAVRPTVSAAVDDSIRRALAPVAADRFASVAQFAQALHATVSGATTVAAPVTTPAASMPRRRQLPMAAPALIAGLLIGGGLLFAWRRTHPGADETAGPKRVAVLPFENLGDTSSAYFADGVSDEVRGKLSQLAGLAVIARASSNEYRHTTKPPQQIARELGVDYLLTATVRWETRDGTSRVRVSPELVRVAPRGAPTTAWQQGFDAALTDVFQVQADIAGQVAQALNVALGDSVRRELATAPTASLGAYDAFLKGEAAWLGGGALDRASLRRAVGWYEQAIALDSTFLGAWAQVARTRASLYQAAPTPRLAEEAKVAAEQARRLGPNRPESFLALATYLAAVLDDLQPTRATLVSGLELAPLNVDLLTALALTEGRLGNFEAALSGLQRAAALDPRSLRVARSLLVAFIHFGRFDSADSVANRMIALAPTSVAPRTLKMLVALGRGDVAAGRAIVRGALAVADPAAVLASVAAEDRFYWILDDAQQQQVLALPPSSFDDDRAVWGMARARLYQVRGDHSLARAYADSARLAIEAQLWGAPEDGQLHGRLGLALAYLGRAGEAVREGRRGAALVPVSRDNTIGSTLQFGLARSYMLIGQPERALDQLDALLGHPSVFSPGLLRVDPDFDHLRSNPRFQKLVEGTT